MGFVEGNCPSEDFRNTKPIESFYELQSQIEKLFNTQIQPNFSMDANMIIVDEYKIKILERHLREEGYNLSKPNYIYKTGWIIIPPLLYNERSFAHEVLHAFSNLASEKFTDSIHWRRDYRRKINITFYEGITEFFTGCLLFRYYPDCYELFRDFHGDRSLGYHYETETKFWYVFIQVFGYDIIKTIYFDRTLKFETFKDLHDLVIEVIKKKYCDFELENSNRFEDWQSELSVVSKKFEKLWLETDRALDFSVFPFLKD